MEGSFANITLGQNSWEDSNLGASSHSQLLGSKTRRENSQTAKEVYKQASSLFLTRRLVESLSIIERVVVPPLGQTDEETQGDQEPAMISSASRNMRIKTWSLYLTLLNAIVELGPEDGKASFGSKVWRDIVNKVQDGSIWEEVVQVGYGGFEGNVDDEVVVNLATLLLSHSPSQTTNQQRLESYLSTPNVARPEFNDQFEVNSGISSSIRGRHEYPNGTTNPQGLASRTKILELYSLHVLPRNSEWTYAKEFINLSEVLDEEGRKSFLEALQSLEVEKSKDLEQLRRLEAERLKELEALQRLEAENSSDLAALRDLEDEKAKDKTHEEPPATPLNSKPVSNPPRRTAKAAKDLHPNILSRPNGSSNRPRKVGIYHGTISIISNLQNLLLNLTQSLSQSPMVLLRFVFFLVALVLALSRNDVRVGVERILASSWNKLRGTVGMGVKVSYI